MLSEAYIEALLVDEELADQFWEVRNGQAHSRGAEYVGLCRTLPAPNRA